MAQKDKVKELVGRGLHSYHTKALQQMDRIEKKNKEQNHKISILSNELDNDYLTKTEEGSVISLEHSKEGMVYLDELQGNTLVNYCTDGSKELTLNGDIDLEGTFVTTTEGVDGGKVDVLCEGNTLVNLCGDNYSNVMIQGSGAINNNNGTITLKTDGGYNKLYFGVYDTLPVKPSTTYTLILDIRNITLERKHIFGFNDVVEGINKKTYTTSSSATNNTNIAVIEVNPQHHAKDSGEVTFFAILLEGDWTDKEIPPYFEGMKSVGQDNENGHKIEILSTNSDGSKSNKKEILLNEPLRGLPNGVKDRFVKIGGKWFIERRYKEVVLADINIHTYSLSDEYPDVFGFYFTPTDIKNTSTIHSICNFLPVIPTNFPGYLNRNYEGISNSYEHIKGCVLKNKLDEVSHTGLINYFSKVDARIAYELKTPIYEPLEINPELICYNDTTHISNNSIIPCNMQVKNSGYNAIIKPSTLYTIALDTDKSGTIGMNLGGAKGTTTNNVLTITTPATLTDDSLRLYGKGIKGSKVRLLEGDKTNWIPSHFEGMKSSFEDKFDATDNTYKMEILSNNKNLFDIDAEYYKAGWGNQNYQRNGNGFSFDAMDGWNSIGYEVKGHRDKTVVVSATVTCINKDTSKLREQSLRVHTETWSGANATSFLDGETKRIKFNVKLNHEGRVYFNGSSSPEGSNNGGVKWTVKDILIEDADGGTGYFPRECNKIQFSSIEPLRGVGNIKDRFVFKDGKLMIERNIKNIVFDGSQSGYYYASWYTNDSLIRVGIRTNTSTVPKNKYNVAPISPQYLGYKWYTAIKCESIHIGGSDDIHFVLDSNRFKTKDLNGAKEFLSKNPIDVCYVLDKPYYEEIPFELQKIILEGYENGTLFFDTNIPPTSTVTYAGETPIVKSVRLNKTEVLNNTNDINDNIIPYLMDMDYRVVCLQLESNVEGISMARLFGGTYEMLQRDIQSKRYSKDEYKYRLDAYLGANKITEDEYNKLGDMLNE